MSEVNCRYGHASRPCVSEALGLKVQFEANACWQPSDAAPVLVTGLAALGDIVNEWIDFGSHANVACSDGAVFIANDDMLLACYCVDEAAYGGLALATESVYDALLAQCHARGFSHVVRVWNYFAAINEEQQGLERYRQFCDARFRAFERAALHDAAYPSACALGHAGGHLVIYALASKQPPVHFENPRQMSAYHYPEQYGPRSPSFARASLLSLADSTHLFVSGTASVVGHETRHPYALNEQLEETFANLDALIAHVESTQVLDGRLAPRLLKVYLRHAQDYAYVQSRVQAVYPDVPCAYVLADVCRADLRLEIDGIWTLCQAL